MSTAATASTADYFEHGADIGVIGRGPSLERAFEAAARAMFAIMAEPDNVGRTVEVEVQFDEDDPEIALVRWLNALLAEARSARAVLAEFELQHSGRHWQGRGRGARWQPNDERGIEVKGATLTALAVRRDENGWEARCVVDV